MGRDALPALRPLLDDKAPALLEGSKDATLSKVYSYRRADFAYRYVCLILGWAYSFERDLGERDARISLAKKRLDDVLLLKTRPWFWAHPMATQSTVNVWRLLPIAVVISICAASPAASAGEIHDLLDRGRVDAAKALVEKNPGLVDSVDDDERTLLHIAAANGQIEMVRFLLKKNANVNAGRGHATPLHCADDPAVVRLLVEHKADLDARDLGGKTALQNMAARCACRDPVARRRWLQITKILLDAGADYDLRSAAHLGDADRVRTLLKTDPALAKQPGLMRIAAEDGRAAVVKLLLEYKVDPNDSGTPGVPVLYFAVDHPEVVKVLLGAGVDPKVPIRPAGAVFWPATGGTVLNRAAGNGQLETVKVLLARGADFDGATVAATVREGHLKLMTYLLDQKAGAAILGQDGPRLMRLAASQVRGSDDKAVEAENRNYQMIIKTLAGRGVPIDFFAAVALGDTPRAKQLLKEHPDLATSTIAGKPALHRAVELDRHEIAVALIDHGAAVDATDDNGDTPLHSAAFWGREEIARLLIDRKADVNASSKSRTTPLHESARLDTAGVAKILLAAAAKVNAKDDVGLTPLGWAQNNADREEYNTGKIPKKTQEMIELLRKHGGKE